METSMKRYKCLHDLFIDGNLSFKRGVSYLSKNGIVYGKEKLAINEYPNFNLYFKEEENESGKTSEKDKSSWLKEKYGIDLEDIAKYLDYNIGSAIKCISGYVNNKSIENLKNAIKHLENEIKIKNGY